MKDNKLEDWDAQYEQLVREMKIRYSRVLHYINRYTADWLHESIIRTAIEDYVNARVKLVTYVDNPTRKER